MMKTPQSQLCLISKTKHGPCAWNSWNLTLLGDLGDSIESLSPSERDYENVIPPHLLRWQQPTPQQTQKADTGVPTPTRFTDHTDCCCRRASIVPLYILVFVSLLIASAAFLLAFLKFIPQCPGGFQKYQTKCFYISTHKHTWAEARRDCSRRSAPLATAEAIKEVNLNLENNSEYWVDNPEGEQNKVTDSESACSTPKKSFIWTCL
nr:uncharacterized protein LOC118079964 isoform X3 [Zootoca vivipara]XP_034960693.1 uncharacterized protein LOC118079964 isoform X3 [Zootoca vivipara]